MIGRASAILQLKDGRVFRGEAFGAAGETVGEVCFNTAVTGYQEVLTDPSYCGQIVVMTAPHIGNYGVNEEDVESARVQVAGFAVREETVAPSNWRSTASLGEYLRRQGIVGIQGIDTRAVTRHIRDRGAMNGILSTVDFNSDSLRRKLEAAPEMNGLDLTPRVTCPSPVTMPNEMAPKPIHRVAAIDYGIKRNILRLLQDRGCEVTLFPATATSREIVELNPAGIFLSNGPGDPAAVAHGVRTVRDLLGKKPIFGICLGHQILALALGAKTYKLKFGHRGTNHPVKNLESGAVEITSQNHGFAVDLDTLPPNVVTTHVNLNDDTSEGIRCTDIPAFSVQYHPEASPGPHDSRYLFEQFTRMMGAVDGQS